MIEKAAIVLVLLCLALIGGTIIFAAVVATYEEKHRKRNKDLYGDEIV